MYLSDNIHAVKDNSFGIVRDVVRTFFEYGWNEGEAAHRFIGEMVQRKTGDPDTTFYELYKRFGIELCVVATNLTTVTKDERMMISLCVAFYSHTNELSSFSYVHTDTHYLTFPPSFFFFPLSYTHTHTQVMPAYFHAKTTPLTPIRDALRCTMSIPLFMKPWTGHSIYGGGSNFFVDGGLSSNFPLHVYDGFYLSMKKEDQWQNHCDFGENENTLGSLHAFRFGGMDGRVNEKTVGFSLADPIEPVVVPRDADTSQR